MHRISTLSAQAKECVCSGSTLIPHQSGIDSHKLNWQPEQTPSHPFLFLTKGTFFGDHTIQELWGWQGLFQQMWNLVWKSKYRYLDGIHFLIYFGPQMLTMQLEKNHRISCWTRQTACVSPHPHSVFVSTMTLKKHMWEYHVGPARLSVFPQSLPKHATFSALCRRVLGCITYPTPLYPSLHHHTSYNAPTPYRVSP